MPKIQDDRRLLDLTVADLRAVVREELEAVLGGEREPAGALLTAERVAALLGVSERTIANLREMGLPVIWVTPDSPRFDRGEVLRWIGEVSPYLAAGEPKPGTVPGWSEAWVAWVARGCRGEKPTE